jgi:hypothetical protein
MNNHKPVLKDDINFLEYPNWLISKRNSPKTYTIEKDNGEYVISTTENIDRLPDRLDKIILYYLMSLLMKNDFEDRVVDVSRYQIAKEALGSFRYDRIMLGLRVSRPFVQKCTVRISINFSDLLFRYFMCHYSFQKVLFWHLVFDISFGTQY